MRPGVEAVEMFRRVQRRVRRAIKQEPYLGFNALPDIYFAGFASATPSSSSHVSEGERAWSTAKDTTSSVALEAFIRRFGDTYYGDLAKMRLDEIRQTGASK